LVKLSNGKGRYLSGWGEGKAQGRAIRRLCREINRGKRRRGERKYGKRSDRS
jgi:hypothetical protein